MLFISTKSGFNKAKVRILLKKGGIYEKSRQPLMVTGF
jgi:hypothetical protein